MSVRGSSCEGGKTVPAGVLNRAWHGLRQDAERTMGILVDRVDACRRHFEAVLKGRWSLIQLTAE